MTMKRLASGCLATLVLSACATVPPSRAIDRLPPVVVAPPVPPLVVLDYLLDSERLANADECTAQINRHDAEAQAVLRQAVQQAELMGWQRCNLATPFPGWVPGPYRYRR